jgi:hypothetical protein
MVKKPEYDLGRWREQGRHIVANTPVGTQAT